MYTCGFIYYFECVIICTRNNLDRNKQNGSIDQCCITYSCEILTVVIISIDIVRTFDNEKRVHYLYVLYLKLEVKDINIIEYSFDKHF